MRYFKRNGGFFIEDSLIVYNKNCDYIQKILKDRDFSVNSRVWDEWIEKINKLITYNNEVVYYSEIVI